MMSVRCSSALWTVYITNREISEAQAKKLELLTGGTHQ
jgi:hypothetical protein